MRAAIADEVRSYLNEEAGAAQQLRLFSWRGTPLLQR